MRRFWYRFLDHMAAMWWLVAAIALAAMIHSVHAAETGQVVAACGTPTGLTYTVPGLGNFTVDQTGKLCSNSITTPAVPGAGTPGAGYPPGATAANGAATGTTAGTTALIPGVVGKISYLCGFSVSPGSATAAITINITVSGIANPFTESVGAPVTAAGTTGLSFTRTFTPCLQSNAVNNSISVAAGALGTGGVNQDVNVWGYQQ